MGHDISGLHHVGHVVRNMEEALARYRQLGFTLPPPSYPTMPKAAGEPPEPFGAANTHVYFPRNFIEVVTLVGDGGTDRIPADAHLVPLRVPDDKLPGLLAAIRGTAANLTACLKRFQGMHIVMFDSPDIDGAAARLEANGVGHGGVHTVQRPVETVGGTRMVPVRYLEIDSHEPGRARGRVPEGRVGIAENGTLDAQRHVDHPNGAVELVQCMMCVADAELPDIERRYENYLGRPARSEGFARTFDLDDAKVTLVPESALAGLLPGEHAPGLPAFVAYAVSVRDAAATERFLRASGVPLAETAAGEIFVPADAALGVAIIFRQAG
ncbi:VOC family protein [Streptosporangium sp. NPDC000396]|uniref:VOC family protein n=1 Tax=Streptosporangium sp. NPDC000396 TaxID=3366185 RepID=UPI0036BCE525